jgi:hypothetical protein
LYDKFIDQLPVDQERFKQGFLENFDGIYDTKYIVNNSNTLFTNYLHNTDLQNCYKVCYNMTGHPSGSDVRGGGNESGLVLDKRNIFIDEHFGDYTLTNLSDENLSFQHEAGFDALMTGYVFFKSLEMLDLNVNDSKNLETYLKFYKNKLPLGGVKVPFNLEEREDIYGDSDVQVFHCNFYGKKEFFDRSIEELTAKYGEFSKWMMFSDTLEFLMVFKSGSDESKLSTD